eukprot:314045_1
MIKLRMYSFAFKVSLLDEEKPPMFHVMIFNESTSFKSSESVSYPLFTNIESFISISDKHLSSNSWSLYSCLLDTIGSFSCGSYTKEKGIKLKLSSLQSFVCKNEFEERLFDVNGELLLKLKLSLTSNELVGKVEIFEGVKGKGKLFTGIGLEREGKLLFGIEGEGEIELFDDDIGFCG